VTQQLRFIDLFSGLGGFHLALSSLGHKCVFASESDSELAELYERNFGIQPAGDIRLVDLHSIPAHDILCAGFPCQPFSKAGGQRGLKCPQWGDLVDFVIEGLRLHTPEFLIIENVPNLVRHNNGSTWEKIRGRLEDVGYTVSERKLSPHMFGVPQVRERILIVGRRGGLERFEWPAATSQKTSIRKVLSRKPVKAKKLSNLHLRYLKAWQSFLDQFPDDEELPSFPIWGMEFGATYPYYCRTPHSHGFKEISQYRGSFGRSLRGLSVEEAIEALPWPAPTNDTTF